MDDRELAAPAALAASPDLPLVRSEPAPTQEFPEPAAPNRPLFGLSSSAPVLRVPALGQRQLGRALAAAGVAAWQWDLRTNEFGCSEEAAGLLGLGDRRLRQPEDFWELIDAQDRVNYRAVVDRALAERKPYICQFRIVRPDGGRIVWIEDRGCVVDEGFGPHAAGLLLDVSEHKRAECERDETRRRAQDLLARQRREQQTILNSVRAMIWYKDAENRILRVNKAAAQSVGLRVEDMIGQRAEDLYPDEAAAYLRDDLQVIRSGEPMLGIIEPLQVFDGSKRWIQTDKIPYRDGEGRVVGVIVFSLDVTERKLAEDVLRESEQTQRDFVANVSHEFRTPVAAIKGFAETLRRGGLADRRNRGRFVRIIENHANRLQWLVEDLLTLSSLESGTDKLKPETIPLRDFVTDYIGSVESLARKAGVSLSARIPRTTRITADQGFFLQVLENLVGNAIKYNRRGGRVRVQAVRRGAFVHLTVRDNGIGIPAASVPRIFDRFYRVNKGAASGATGLGLHIVKKIVEAHGGRIWVESRLGRGSAFHLLVPAAPSRRADDSGRAPLAA
jgi:two-component system phosphate regulon sensor histidine kinase PhoR